MKGHDMAGFSGLTFAVLPVVVNTGSDGSPVWALNPTLVTDAAAGTTRIACIVDPTATQRIFNPVAEGCPVVLGTDTAATWLPALTGLSAASITDYISVTAPGSAIANIGQVTINLTPAAKNVVEASSVMSFKVSPQALILTATGTF